MRITRRHHAALSIAAVLAAGSGDALHELHGPPLGHVDGGEELQDGG